MRPRCRWVIDKTRRMEPYRLKVALVENTRVDGKVKQELVATLGSIDATWLDSFWAAVGDDELARFRVPDWRHQSLKARRAFWQDVLARMGKIGDNRLTQDQRKAIRREIHKVVPWVMEHERTELELAEAKREFKAAQKSQANTQAMVVANDKLIASTQAKRETLQKLSAFEAEQVLHAGLRVAKLDEELAKLRAPSHSSLTVGGGQ
jgi:hypothetical protein